MPPLLRVLILDDRDDHAREWLGLLAHEGFRVEGEQAMTAEAAQLWLEQPWDVVLANADLPYVRDVTGPRLLNDREREVPVVLISGSSGEDLAVEWMRNGADDYLLAAHPERLGRAVREAMRRRREVTDRQRVFRPAADSDLAHVQEANRRLAAILESSPDFVGLADLEGHMFYINRSGLAMVGRPATTAEGTGDYGHLSDFHPRWAADLLLQVGIPQALETGLWSGEAALQHRDRDLEIPVSQTVLAHRSASGQVAYLSTIARDITRQKELEEQIRLAQKMEAVGRLAGGVAHDFNNILTIILGYADLVQNRVRHDSPSMELVQRISDAARRAATLTRQLLAFSRKQVLQPRVIQLNHSIRETEQGLRQFMGEGIEWDLKLQDDLWETKADPGQIEQVILNLAMNAREAMPDGGQLRISTRNRTLTPRDTRDNIELLPGDYVELLVADTGRGMDAVTLAHVFEPFFTTKQTGQGVGMGLATVYGVVKQSEGHVQVESRLGQGTRFSIFLPRHGEPVRDVRLVSHGLGERKSGATILLVEDDEAVRRLARYALQAQGYLVHEAANGKEALEVYDALGQPVDILLTDVIMPLMNGRELAEQLLTRQPSLEVLYMSGYSDDAVVQRKLLTSTGSFLQKPFTPAVLAGKLREVLERRGA
jgi:two-component system, cell cycle sensor histidine kinase and response regulator CckA